MSEEVKQYAQPAREHVSLGSTLRGVLFVIPTAVVALLFYALAIQKAVSLPLAIGTTLVL